MKLDDFKTLSDSDKENYLSSIETTQRSLDDLTAERDSFRTENDDLKKQLEANGKELKATKEMNFTLARKINTAPQEDDDTTLLNFIFTVPTRLASQI